MHGGTKTNVGCECGCTSTGLDPFNWICPPWGYIQWVVPTLVCVDGEPHIRCHSQQVVHPSSIIVKDRSDHICCCRGEKNKDCETENDYSRLHLSISSATQLFKWGERKIIALNRIRTAEGEHTTILPRGWQAHLVTSIREVDQTCRIMEATHRTELQAC